MALASLAEARVQTVRVVSGCDALVQGLLQYVLRRDCVRKLWLEDVPLRCLNHLLETAPELRDGRLDGSAGADGDGSSGSGSGSGLATGLTHLRLRKLRDTSLPQLVDDGPPKPHDGCVPRFLRALVSHSPRLTSLALDALPDLDDLPAILEPLTFPHLVAFQLRSQIEDQCVVPYYLTDPALIGFLGRHADLRAFAWPAENFAASAAAAASLLPLMDQFARRLVWFRADCCLLDNETFDHQSRYTGAPRVSRCFLARWCSAMHCLETLKLQGDWQDDELELLLDAIGRSPSSRTLAKFSLIRAGVGESVLGCIVAAMPRLRELKLCAYFPPGLVSLYDVDVEAYEEEDGVHSNMTLVTSAPPLPPSSS